MNQRPYRVLLSEGKEDLRVIPELVEATAACMTTRDNSSSG